MVLQEAMARHNVEKNPADFEPHYNLAAMLEAGGLPKNLAAAWRQLLEPDGKSGVAPSPATVDVD